VGEDVPARQGDSEAAQVGQRDGVRLFARALAGIRRKWLVLPRPGFRHERASVRGAIAG